MIVGPWAHLYQGSGLDLEPISSCVLFIFRVFKIFCVYLLSVLLFHFFGLGPICDEFRTWTSNLVLFFYLFYRVFESLCVSYLFHVNCRFMSSCYLCLNIFSSNHVVLYSNYASCFNLINVVFVS